MSIAKRKIALAKLLIGAGIKAGHKALVEKDRGALLVALSTVNGITAVPKTDRGQDLVITHNGGDFTMGIVELKKLLRDNQNGQGGGQTALSSAQPLAVPTTVVPPVVSATVRPVERRRTGTLPRRRR